MIAVKLSRMDEVSTPELSPNAPGKLWEIQRRVAVLVKTAGAYLGVAAFVIVLLVLTVPALRYQVTLLHEAVLVALAPEGTRAAISRQSSIDTSAPPRRIALARTVKCSSSPPT